MKEKTFTILTLIIWASLAIPINALILYSMTTIEMSEANDMVGFFIGMVGFTILSAFLADKIGKGIDHIYIKLFKP